MSQDVKTSTVISTEESSKSEPPPPKMSPESETLAPEICSVCNGAGCCTLCDRPDDEENMVFCANETEKVHLLHLSCANITQTMARQVDKYYCPTCRLDPNNEITFDKKVTAAKKAEIMKNILKNDPISKKTIPKKCKKNLKKAKKLKLMLRLSKNVQKNLPQLLQKHSHLIF